MIYNSLDVEAEIGPECRQVKGKMIVSSMTRCSHTWYIANDFHSVREPLHEKQNPKNCCQSCLPEYSPGGA
jgi:hypothetical protein